ncbi:YafY family protein [Pseudomonas sp. GV071]|uniref:helix-turn-helix transcriptional regulator n=1 Tax=Pseudomonas sp. GV071 TaxID=2135754 RepID=UPI000D350171|nr:WYL domain-containing protein [Pseudomonas sp. GV071]PTQ70306.1 putative DNA-binding transcriptional regulator YafY [Pseudomonas sp. GV071]
MSEAKDTLLRQLALLRLIPRDPQRRATTTLLEKLREEGFSVSLRTLQRDLENLSGPFTLDCDTREIPYRWSFPRNAPFDLAAMDTPTALALFLAENHLKSLLPQIVLDQLSPQFNRARNHLEGLHHNELAHWGRRVRAMPNGKVLLPAEIRPEVWREISTALLERRQLQVSYLSRSKAEHKTFTLHPGGLVSRHSVSYLIGTVDGYADARQFALHRIVRAEMLSDTVLETEPLDVDRYIHNGGFNSPGPIEEAELVADVSAPIAWLLSETPLSHDQHLEPLPGSDWQRLRARVPMDQETLWWVFGLGEKIRVHAPLGWADEIAHRAKAVSALYETR